MDEAEDDILQLGGSIELSGFSNLDYSSMIVLKKIIGNYVRKMNDRSGNFERLSMTMKSVHKTEKHQIYEIHAKIIDNGQVYTSSVEDRNLFVAVDNVLKKVMS